MHNTVANGVGGYGGRDDVRHPLERPDRQASNVGLEIRGVNQWHVEGPIVSSGASDHGAPDGTDWGKVLVGLKAWVKAYEGSDKRHPEKIQGACHHSPLLTAFLKADDCALSKQFGNAEKITDIVNALLKGHKKSGTLCQQLEDFVKCNLQQHIRLVTVQRRNDYDSLEARLTHARSRTLPLSGVRAVVVADPSAADEPSMRSSAAANTAQFVPVVAVVEQNEMQGQGPSSLARTSEVRLTSVEPKVKKSTNPFDEENDDEAPAVQTEDPAADPHTLNSKEENSTTPVPPPRQLKEAKPEFWQDASKALCQLLYSYCHYNDDYHIPNARHIEKINAARTRSSILKEYFSRVTYSSEKGLDMHLRSPITNVDTMVVALRDLLIGHGNNGTLYKRIASYIKGHLGEKIEMVTLCEGAQIRCEVRKKQVSPYLQGTKLTSQQQEGGRQLLAVFSHEYSKSRAQEKNEIAQQIHRTFDGVFEQKDTQWTASGGLHNLTDNTISALITFLSSHGNANKENELWGKAFHQTLQAICEAYFPADNPDRFKKIIAQQKVAEQEAKELAEDQKVRDQIIAKLHKKVEGDRHLARLLDIFPPDSAKPVSESELAEVKRMMALRLDPVARIADKQLAALDRTLTANITGVVARIKALFHRIKATDQVAQYRRDVDSLIQEVRQKLREDIDALTKSAALEPFYIQWDEQIRSAQIAFEKLRPGRPNPFSDPQRNEKIEGNLHAIRTALYSKQVTALATVFYEAISTELQKSIREFNFPTFVEDKDPNNYGWIFDLWDQEFNRSVTSFEQSCREELETIVRSKLALHGSVLGVDESSILSKLNDTFQEAQKKPREALSVVYKDLLDSLTDAYINKLKDAGEPNSLAAANQLVADARNAWKKIVSRCDKLGECSYTDKDIAEVKLRELEKIMQTLDARFRVVNEQARPKAWARFKKLLKKIKDTVYTKVGVGIGATGVVGGTVVIIAGSVGSGGALAVVIGGLAVGAGAASFIGVGGYMLYDAIRKKRKQSQIKHVENEIMNFFAQERQQLQSIINALTT